MIPYISPGGNNNFRLESFPRQLFVGTSAGIFLLENGRSPKEWSVSRCLLPECHVHAILIEPSSGMLLAGIQKGGIFASSDFGEHWVERGHGLIADDVYTLNCAMTDEGPFIYAGTEPPHLFASNDFGETWSELEGLRSVPSAPKWHYPQPPNIGHVKQIVFDPGNPRILYACIEQGALLRSHDRGVSWEELHGFYEDVHRLVISSSNSRKMYLACGDGLYCSEDGGETWERLTTRAYRVGYPDGLVVHPENDQLIFISGAATIPPTWAKNGTANASIGRSRDGGRTWEFLDGDFRPNFIDNIEALTMVTWKNSYCLLAATTGGEVLFSGDEGNTWVHIVVGLPPIAKRKHHLYLKDVRKASEIGI
jgi:photosystem II stability/assembly factor-like uncharacterized protein